VDAAHARRHLGSRSGRSVNFDKGGAQHSAENRPPGPHAFARCGPDKPEGRFRDFGRTGRRSPPGGLVRENRAAAGAVLGTAFRRGRRGGRRRNSVRRRGGSGSSADQETFTEIGGGGADAAGGFQERLAASVENRISEGLVVCQSGSRQS